MASSKGYLDFILGQLSPLQDITYRAMMGEYRAMWSAPFCLSKTTH